MTFSQPILSLVCDEVGSPLVSFLTAKPDEWVAEQMRLRYAAVPPAAEDPPDHPAVLAAAYLHHERVLLKNWFVDGKLSTMLMSRTLSRLSTGPIGNGFSCDFLADGTPDVRMLRFKGTLIAAYRSAELKPSGKRLDCGGHELSAVAKLVRSAYMTRATAHSWTAEGSVPGAELAKRWIAFRTHSFLVRFGAEDNWAWNLSGANKVFGPVDLTAAQAGEITVFEPDDQEA
jgi:hypothetical protein